MDSYLNVHRIFVFIFSYRGGLWVLSSPVEKLRRVFVGVTLMMFTR